MLLYVDMSPSLYIPITAAAYGKGVYFAVNANYSAGGFSQADAAGLKRLYVARVLTGRYTVGNHAMKSPPPRGADPTDCFDSVVNNQQPPSMFVIFHDDQAYPEYLITFRWGEKSSLYTVHLVNNKKHSDILECVWNVGQNCTEETLLEISIF